MLKLILIIIIIAPIIQIKAQDKDSPIKAYKSLNFGDENSKIVEKLKEIYPKTITDDTRMLKIVDSHQEKKFKYYTAFLGSDEKFSKFYKELISTSRRGRPVNRLNDYLEQSKVLWTGSDPLTFYICSHKDGLNYVSVDYKNVNFETIKNGFLKAYSKAKHEVIDKHNFLSAHPQGFTISLKRDIYRLQNNNINISFSMPINYSISFTGTEEQKKALPVSPTEIIKASTKKIDEMVAKNKVRLASSGIFWKPKNNANQYLLEDLLRTNCNLEVYSHKLMKKLVDDFELKEKELEDSNKKNQNKNTDDANGF